MAYTTVAPPVEADLETVVLWVSAELERVSLDLALLEELELHSAPTQPFHQQKVLADGTDWNPGSGRGVYYYDEDTAGWKFIA